MVLKLAGHHKAEQAHEEVQKDGATSSKALRASVSAAAALAAGYSCSAASAACL